MSTSTDTTTRSPPNALLSTNELRKSFGGIEAVDGLDIAIQPGELVGLIGPNGAGKTTTVNLITGFLQPTDGDILFGDEMITNDQPHQVSSKGVGRTFQISKPFGRLSVFENMLVPNVPYGRAKQEERAHELIDRLDLSAVEENRADALSGGQKKLLELARVLMLEPDLVLLDEPAAGVNPALMDDIIAHIKEINAGGTAILVIEHDMSVINELCERVIVMSAGQKIMTGTFDEIRQDERVRSAYLGK